MLTDEIRALGEMSLYIVPMYLLPSYRPASNRKNSLSLIVVKPNCSHELGIAGPLLALFQSLPNCNSMGGHEQMLTSPSCFFSEIARLPCFHSLIAFAFARSCPVLHCSVFPSMFKAREQQNVHTKMARLHLRP